MNGGDGSGCSTPRVSVVIAAYNSSGRLRCAVESALEQDVTNLEVIVVGDACTDDSAEVLGRIGDDRVRWENLSTNWGEQSVPSNRGIELARGRFIFFLNQDDLWRRHHVRSCLTLLERADMVWSPYLVVPPGCRPGSHTEPRPELFGVSPSHPQFCPYTFIPASCTAWRADALRSLGGWRTAAQVFVSPSQDVLWRASRAGLTQVGATEPTVIVLWSGERAGSYQPEYKPADNEAWLEAVRSNSEVMDEEIRGSREVAMSGKPRTRSLRLVVRRIYVRVSEPICERIGLHPHSPYFALRYRRSGGFINTIRAFNELERVDFRAEDRRGATS